MKSITDVHYLAIYQIDLPPCMYLYDKVVGPFIVGICTFV